VQNVIGVCKTETSQKPVPAHDDLVKALREWHRQTPYQSSESWVFASPVNHGRWPFLAQEIMRHHVVPVARKLASQSESAGILFVTLIRRCFDLPVQS
jgi:hypothetical protein